MQGTAPAVWGHPRSVCCMILGSLCSPVVLLVSFVLMRWLGMHTQNMRISTSRSRFCSASTVVLPHTLSDLLIFLSRWFCQAGLMPRRHLGGAVEQLCVHFDDCLMLPTLVRSIHAFACVGNPISMQGWVVSSGAFYCSMPSSFYQISATVCCWRVSRLMVRLMLPPLVAV